MTLRIGFAFNEKPADEGGSSLDEPPSNARLKAASHDRYAEWDEPATIAAVEAALSRVGIVTRLEADEDFPQKLRSSRPDIVFNIAEGLHGPNREAHVPAICEFFGIRYTASDPLALALALDKHRAKEVFVARGVPTPGWLVRGANGNGRLPGAGPWIVKPLFEGSSKGIPQSAFCTSGAAVSTRANEIALEYDQAALIEEFLPGREFTVGVLGNGDRARVLPPVEIRFDALPAGAPPIYGYEAKWLWDTPSDPLRIFECPADIDARLAAQLEAATLGAYHALGCRDWSRIDLRLDAQGNPHVIEVNPLPGILPDPTQNSCLPKAARAAGLAYDDLIIAALDAALERYGMQR